MFRDISQNENQILYFKHQNYIALKNECLRNGTLFEDPEFKPEDKSIFYTKPLPYGVRWMRPEEIVRLNYTPREPRFIVNRAEAGDLDQGYLGNCWFIAGCIAITYLETLFKKVVPQGQVLTGKDYAGIYHFRFWIYGKWHDVVIDDLLPVYENGTLIFCHNTEEPNEFWAALLEKAFAKVCGSYENLEGGFTADALIDMSGGIEETLILKHNNSKEIWRILVQGRRKKSMAGAYIDADPYIPEMKLPNGLVKGHAYIITRTATVNSSEGEALLIRLRNPWGNEIRWNGDWSEKSLKWNSVSEAINEKLASKKQDGEFWMALEDFYANFDSIQFCHLTPDSLSEEILKIKHNKYVSWKMVGYDGEWTPGISAGGSGNSNNETFWTNPQFLIKLEDVDFEDNEDKTTIIISLMQKYTREKRTQNNGQLSEDFIQFRIYRIRNIEDVAESIRNGHKLLGQQLERIGNSGDYINKREVVSRFRLSPGYYVIIPSLFNSNVNGHFLLRIFTEEYIDKDRAHILNENNVISNSTVRNEVSPQYSTAKVITNIFQSRPELKKVSVGRHLYSANPSVSLESEPKEEPSLADLIRDELNIKELTTQDRSVRSSKKQCKIM